jgi:YVTN family beta-propeller protein
VHDHKNKTARRTTEIRPTTGRTTSLTRGVFLALSTGILALFMAMLGSGVAAASASAAPDEMAYAVNATSKTVTPIDVTTGTKGTAISTGLVGFGIAINPEGTLAYVAAQTSSTVTSINLETRAVLNVSLNSPPLEIAFTPDGTTAFATNETSGTVTPINVATATAGTPIPVGKSPMGIAVDPDGKTVYVVNEGSNTVTPIDVATRTAGTPIAVGVKPIAVAFSPDGSTAYVTNETEGTVTPIDVASGTADTPIHAGTNPYAIVVTPDNETALVTNAVGTGTITPINLGTGVAGTPISVGSQPKAIALSSDGETALVSSGTNVVPVNLTTDTAGAAISAGTATVQGIAFVPQQQPASTAPVFTSDSQALFQVVENGSFKVQATEATSFAETGALPQGLTFHDNGDGTATISGVPGASTLGQYRIQITATGGGGEQVQNFVIKVGEPPEITSAGSANIAAGQPGSFTVKTTGTSPFSLSETGSLPSGISFKDNGDGTATISGEPTGAEVGSYPITITAHNGFGADAKQSFTLNVVKPLKLESDGSANFYTGAPGAFTVVVGGTPAPSLSEEGALPDGLKFTDNGNGTATISGTPESGTSGTYLIDVTAHNGVSPDAIQALTLTVANGNEPVNVPDPNLRAALDAQLGANFTAAQAANITVLNISSSGPIADLTGLEALRNLTVLTITNPGNTFKDLGPLESLTKLRTLELQGDPNISNVDPLVSESGLVNLTLTNDHISDLSTLPSLPNLEALNVPNNEISDLSTLPSLPSLGSLDLEDNRVSDLSALSSFPRLAGLNLRENVLSSLSTFPDLPEMVSLSLADNQLSSLSGLPQFLNLTELNLAENQISSAAEVESVLSAKTTLSKLLTLDLSENDLTEASPLVPLGTGSNPLGDQRTLSEGLFLTGNRIADFSPFSVWIKPPTSDSLHEQTIYVGPYDSLTGITIPALKDVNGATPTVVSGEPATYEPQTTLLTLTGAKPVSSITLADGNEASWVVVFSAAPEATDPTAPTIAATAQNEGAANKVDEKLTVTSPGTWMGSVPCTTEYQWLRDGTPIQAVPHANETNEPGLDPGGEAVGDGGQGPNYIVQPQDIGHRISVQVSCAGTPLQDTSTPTAVVGAGGTTPVIQALEGETGFGYVGDLVVPGTGERASVLGDPTTRKLPIWVGQLGANGQQVDPSTLTVVVTSTNNAVLPAEDVTVTGTGNERTVSFDPQAVGKAVITLTVSSEDGETSGQKSFQFNYYVTPAEAPTSREMYGLSDASTAIEVGDGYLMIGDDQDNQIFLYNSEKSELPEAEFSLYPGHESFDIEASARKGNTLYWFGSEGNSDSGRFRPERDAMFASTLNGSGASATLTSKGTLYTGMKQELIKWDEAHGNRFGFAAGSVAGVEPDEPNGFNIEGAEFSPDGSQLYLGFRAPLVPAVPGGKALIVPVDNIEALIEGTAAHAEFGEPIELNLDGGQIREIRKNASGEYLILASPSADNSAYPGESEREWVWNGEPDSQPLELSGVLPFDTDDGSPAEPAIAAWEGVGAMPEHLEVGDPVRLVMDQGADPDPANGLEQKESAQPAMTKSETDLIPLGAPVETEFGISAAPHFAEQAEGTTGPAQTLTITNNSFTTLNEVKISSAATEGASADDFLISNDTCEGVTLTEGQSCTVHLRYSPSGEQTTSNAELVIKGNIPGGSASVPLTGTMSAAPAGEKGEPGQTGSQGATGPQGAQGEPGTTGANGSQGGTGPAGPAGPQGATGKDGAQGPKGEAGPRGPAGKDGSFTFEPADANLNAHPGGKLALAFKLANGTDEAVGATAKATPSKGLSISGAHTLKIKPLASGKSGTVRFEWKVGRNSKPGAHKVEVRLTVGGASVTRTVTVHVAG